jgi:hypothetical protein
MTIPTHQEDADFFMVEWISDVVPRDALIKIMAQFEIGGEHMEQLCHAIYRVKRVRSPRSAAKLGNRQAVFKTALEQFRTLPNAEFRKSGEGMVYSTLPPLPPGHTSIRREAGISSATFEAMLRALNATDDVELGWYEKEKAHRKALGNNAKPRRHSFWFGLMTFWHYDLGRPLTITTDPITGERGGRLVSFIGAVSSYHLAEEERTPAAIAGFIRRNKTRAINDPHFGDGSMAG